MIYCWNICRTFKLTHRSHSRCGNMQYVIKMIPLYMQIKWPCCCKGNKSEAIRIPSCGVTKMEHVGCTYLTVAASHWKSSSCSSFSGAFSAHPDYFVWQRVLPALITWKMLSQLNIHLCIRQPRPFCTGPAVWNNRSLPIKRSWMLMRRRRSQQLNNSYPAFICGFVCINAPSYFL